jgi:uncharacterized membrane protein
MSVIRNTKRRGRVRVNKSDFSGADLPKRSPRWGLYLAVALFHVLALAGLNAALTLNRLAAQAEQSFDVAILPQDAPAQKSQPAKPETPTPPQDASAKPDALPAEPAEAAPIASPAPVTAAPESPPAPAVAAAPPHQSGFASMADHAS